MTKTANKLDKIQVALDRVMDNLKLGTPIDDLITTVQDEGTNDTSNIETSNRTEVKSQVENSHEIFDRNMLLDVLKQQKVDKLKNPPRVTVGMIGYPNVGKSSSVNVLMQIKKVSS